MNRVISFLLSSVSVVMISCATTGEKTNAMQQQTSVDFGKEGKAFMQYCTDTKGSIDALAAQIKTLDGSKQAAAIVDLYNNLEIKQSDALNKASIFQMNHPDEGMRASAMACEQMIVAQSTDISMDTALYKILAAINPQDAALSEEDRYFLKDVLIDFKREGVDKDEKIRAELKEISAQLADLEQKFFVNIRGDKKTVVVSGVESLKGLPADYLDAHKPDAEGKITLTTDWPDYYPVMLFADDETLREKMWRAKLDIGYPANTEVFKEVLKFRRKKAELLGYTSWAQYSQEKLMIENPENAHAFITKVKALAAAFSARDVAEMFEMKKKVDPKAVRVEPWDSAYYQRLVKKAKFDFDPEEARKYFEIQKVMEGIFKISGQLFGITFTKVTRNDVWHPSIQSYDVTENGKVIGQIDLDLYPRANKYKHFAMFSNEAGIKDKRLTRSAIVGNFPEPVNGKAYLTHDEVQTLFHEFGHLLHSIFAGNQKYARFSGTNCQRDFVEVPSQLMEEWVWESAVLKQFATNDAGEAIPEALIERMKKADEFAKGTVVMQQMYYAALSLGLYLEDPATLDPHAFEMKTAKEYSPYPVYENTHMIEGFGHLIGYGSNYYTYMWSLGIVKDFYNYISEKGILNPEVTHAYRSIVLNKGGAEPAKQSAKEFLKRDFSVEAFEKWLKN